MICAVGDVHGHMQLALVMAARWLGVRFDAVLLAGDVAAYRRESRLDGATRRHAESNPFETELLKLWMTQPPAGWLQGIFAPEDAGGLGLECPVVMVSGNHEDFEHLASITPPDIPDDPVAIEELPRVDPGRRISLLPRGWRCVTRSGVALAGLGGVHREQRSKYKQGAYIDEYALEVLMEVPPVDILLTHTGPAAVQPFPRGTPVLDPLLHRELALSWFHGHSIANEAIVHVGKTVVVPLHGVAFEPRSSSPADPGRKAWCIASFKQDSIEIDRLGPDPHRRDHAFWYELTHGGWTMPRDRRGRPINGLEDQRVPPHLVSWT
jgi:hypothetical protein